MDIMEMMAESTHIPLETHDPSIKAQNMVLPSLQEIPWALD